jgi:hypothetical protein
MNKQTQSDKVLISYLEQQYRISNRTFAPVSELQDSQSPSGFIISAWSPNGKATLYEENLGLSWELQKQLDKLKLKYKKIIQVEKTRAWIEDAFLIEGLNARQARALAKKFKQVAFVELTQNVATVYETNSKQKQSTQIGLVPTQYGCPAKRNGEDLEEFCKQHGFWTTGQALAALGNWRDNLTIVNSRLGCNLCNNVTTHPSKFVKTANTEHIANIRVTSRHSIAQWVRL